MVSILIGCVIAGMIAINGRLSALYGILGATVVIHLVGSVFALGVIKLRKQKLNLNPTVPLWLLSGGMIGVCTTVCNNAAYGKISMTSIVALGLFGQTLTSLAIDHFGLFHMPKYKFNKAQFLGLTFAIIGMAVMLDDMGDAVLTAIVLSLTAGMSVVLSRTVNAGLSNRIGALQGSFINHLVGLPITIVILLLFGRGEPIFTGFTISSQVWIYLGGVLGVMVVLLFYILRRYSHCHRNAGQYFDST
ncbi:MAG: DMT family transporter [Hungatella sp.]